MTAGCAAHRSHRPPALTDEHHHVIPQDFQRHFPTPATLPAGAVAGHGDHGPLWDARTVLLCPTGHRNVHRVLEALIIGAPLPAGYGTTAERKIATAALDRALEAGITVADLRLVGCRGEA